MSKIRCKCRYTGKEGTVGEFYKVVVNNENHYYKDKETYMQAMKERGLREKIIKVMTFDILQYPKIAMLPTVFRKKVKDWSDIYPYEVILKCILDNIDILKAEGSIPISKTGKTKFKSERNKVLYISAIIDNNLIDSYKQWEREREIKRSRESNKIESDIDSSLINHSMDTTNRVKKDGDISDFI